MTTMLFRGVLALGLLTACLAQFVPILTRETTTEPPVQKPATYWITYSKTVRPGHSMVFNVHVLKGTSAVSISIALKDSYGNAVVTHGPVSVMPMVPNEIYVDIPLDIKKPSDERWGWQQYDVEVTGRGVEVSFMEKGKASYQEKAFSIFVQTDKAMYKPSQKVQFRTLAMTPDMKVMRDVKQDIVVSDSKGNRILQFKGVQASENLGVYEKTFTLASSVPTGLWTIKVTIEGVEESKQFEVSDYVLPKFEVEVDGLPYGLVNDYFYEFTVRATYTFGKPVTDGKVYVEIKFDAYYRNEADRKRWVKEGTLDRNGELKVQVSTRELVMLGQTVYPSYDTIQRWWTFEIIANVTETRTGKKHSGKHSIQFYSTPVKLSILEITPGTFKSGLDYTAYIEVKKQDGSLFSPMEFKQMSLKINVTYSVQDTTPTTTAKPLASGSSFGRAPMYDDYYYFGRRTKEMELKLNTHVYAIPETGWVVVSFRVPDDALSMNLMVRTQSSYEEVQQSKYVAKSHSPSDSFLQLNVINKKPRVGDTIQVNAKSTDSMKLLNFQIFSKGILIGAYEVQGASRNIPFQFVATKSMAPSMSIVAFYVRDDGEFVVDALSLSVEGLFDNAVNVEFSKEKVQPGEAVDLIVRGEGDSLVFFLVVDKSVKLLKSGNDITQEMVMEELSSYDYGNYGNWRYMFICGWPSYLGGDDAQSVFDNAGVVVLTDGLLYSRPNEYHIESRGPNGANTSSYKVTSVGEKARRTRKDFPETWLWNIASISRSTGQVVVPLKSPDTITTWLASVFSVNPRSGLSVAEKPAEVITFRDMFISLDLPSFIVRGEDFCFKASVFNYYPGNVPILLTLEPNEGFTNIIAKKENNQIVLSKEQMYYSHFMGFLNENDVKTVTFCFTPIKIGEITIRASALTDVDGLSDAVERKLRVKPEGFPHSTTMSQLVTPTNGYWSQEIPVQFPEDTVSGSERISVNIAGNLLGPIFENLDDLLQKPYGCGEQNMINFSPIMSLVDFFFTTNTMTEEFRQKAVDYMLIGYQKEILYEHGETGSYSTFGNSANTEEVGSMWLTAFVTKCFSQAEILDMKYGNILAMDVNLIERSAKWMVSAGNQMRDGKFVEKGRVFNTRLQGGSSKGIALTSYTVISLHRAVEVLMATPGKQYRDAQRGMRNAVMYLEENLPSLTDPYDICITTYALTLVGSPSSNMSFVMMENIARNGFDDMKYWERPQQENINRYYWSRGSDAINIEMTSYALLTYSLLGIGTTSGLPIIRWLSKQKGPNGGFISTQDTVIGIEALTSVAKDLYGEAFVPMTITVSTRDTLGIGGTFNFQVNKENEMLLQRNDIPYKAGSKIGLEAQTLSSTGDSSKSTVLVDVVFHYNVLSETKSLAYDMSHQVKILQNGFDFDLWIKIWTVDGKPASMTVLEVDVPAGYEEDEEEIIKFNDELISKIDRKEDRLNVYVNTDKIKGTGIQLKLAMLHTGGTLIKSKGKTYKVYNYYEPDMELTKEYFLVDDRDFCSKVPDFGICPYQ